MLNFSNSLVLSDLCLNKKKKLLSTYAVFNSITVGQVLTIVYFFPARDGLKRRVFTGVCLSKINSVTNQAILLRNSYRSNSIEVSFNLKSPLLLSVKFTYWYRKKIKLSKLYFIRKLRQKSFIRS